MINHELVGAEMRYDRVKMNKPFYVGTVVLDSSKLHMYDFHYNVMKEVFARDFNCYTRTQIHCCMRFARLIRMLNCRPQGS